MMNRKASILCILIIILLLSGLKLTGALALIPNDSDYSNQWYLTKIKAPGAWDIAKQSPNTVIAVLDSGVQIDHPDLKDNIWVNEKEIPGNGKDDDKNGYIDDINGWDFINNLPDPRPKFKSGFSKTGIMHGTVIAGIIAAKGNNTAGVAGITWRARVMPVKVLDDKLEGTTSLVAKGIDYAVANGADIINLSFAGFHYSKNLNDAIERAYGRGVIMVAAAGGEQEQGFSLNQTALYPACYDGIAGQNRVIGVAATDAMDQKTVFSGYGFKCVDIAAPGLSLYSTTVYAPEYFSGAEQFNKYYDGWRSGASFAVPIVSGSLALIQGANPSLNRSGAIKVLLNTADNINRLNPDYLNQLGRGRLNLMAAVDAAAGELVKNKERIIISAKARHPALIKATDHDGKPDKEFYAYDKNWQNGVALAACDINADNAEEIITGAGAGAAPEVKIFKANGQPIGEFLAYSRDFRGGINLTCVDLEGDGKPEIITAPASGAEPLVKIFDSGLNLKKSFYAYSRGFRGGVNLAGGDIDNDGLNDIITGAGEGGGPQVRVFNADGRPQSQFFAYNQKLRHGVRVALINHQGGTNLDRSAIVTAPGRGGLPEIKIFNSRAVLARRFSAFNSNFRGGVGLAGADLDNDGLDEIITAAGPGGTPHVRVFEADGRLFGSFYAYEENYNGGVNVGSIRLK